MEIIVGDCRTALADRPEKSIHCCVTSPPYFGLRDYGVAGQMGLEETPDEFVSALVEVFREVRRVLRDDGTLWLNLGDSYARNASKGGSGVGGKNEQYLGDNYGRARADVPPGLKEKDLIGIPWMVAFALRADGWYLRRDIIWHKQNPMPESVRDRPTNSHEYIFLMSKKATYYYDADAIVEPVSLNTHLRLSQNVAAQIGSERANGGTRSERPMKAVGKNSAQNVDRSPNPRKMAAVGSGIKNNESFSEAVCLPVTHRNKRTVWTVATEAYREAHFATFPPALIEPCILAGCPVGGTVLDPFGGAGTTGLVADRLQRSAVLVELNPEYAAMARRRIHNDAPLFSEAAQ